MEGMSDCNGYGRMVSAPLSSSGNLQLCRRSMPKLPLEFASERMVSDSEVSSEGGGGVGGSMDRSMR